MLVDLYSIAGFYVFIFLGLPLIVGIIGGLWGSETFVQKNPWAELPPAALPVQEPVFENESEHSRVKEIIADISMSREEDAYKISVPSLEMEKNINELFQALEMQKQDKVEVTMTDISGRDSDENHSAVYVSEEKLNETFMLYLKEQENEDIIAESTVDHYTSVGTSVLEGNHSNTDWANDKYMEEDVVWGQAIHDEEEFDFFNDESFSFTSPPSVLLPEHYAFVDQKYGSVVAQSITTTPALGPKELFDVMLGRVQQTSAGYELFFANSSIQLSGNFPKEDGLVTLVYGQFISDEVFFATKHENPSTIGDRIPFPLMDDEDTLVAVGS